MTCLIDDYFSSLNGQAHMPHKFKNPYSNPKSSLQKFIIPE